MPLNESGEMYLESILVLEQGREECSRREPRHRVHATQVAEYLAVSKPAVSRAVALLKVSKYLEVAEDGALVLTALGRKQAETTYERHVSIARFLEQLGVPSEIADKDACRIEHIISDETFAHIKKQLQ